MINNRFHTFAPQVKCIPLRRKKIFSRFKVVLKAVFFYGAKECIFTVVTEAFHWRHYYNKLHKWISVSWKIHNCEVKKLTFWLVAKITWLSMPHFLVKPTICICWYQIFFYKIVIEREVVLCFFNWESYSAVKIFFWSSSRTSFRIFCFSIFQGRVAVLWLACGFHLCWRFLWAWNILQAQSSQVEIRNL